MKAIGFLACEYHIGLCQRLKTISMLGGQEVLHRMVFEVHGGGFRKANKSVAWQNEYSSDLKCDLDFHISVINIYSV